MTLSFRTFAVRGPCKAHSFAVRNKTAENIHKTGETPSERNGYPQKIRRAHGQSDPAENAERDNGSLPERGIQPHGRLPSPSYTDAHTSHTLPGYHKPAQIHLRMVRRSAFEYNKNS